MRDLALPSSWQTMVRLLKERHRIDVTQYQPASVLRRITLRMEQVGILNYAAYADYLSSASDECDQLVNTILINYTAFFRDPDVWATIATEILPQIVANKPAAAPLRIWSAGCAMGQEPYSLAMLVAELIGLEQTAARVTIYATDVDVDALQQVRQARYHLWSVRMVPPVLLDRYFVRDDRHYVVREELRRAVVAEPHNLLTDAPPPQIDLLLCRNVLIYLKAAAQRHVIEQLRGALANDGLLVLGKPERALAVLQGDLRLVNTHGSIAAKVPDGSGVATPHWQAGDSAYA